MDREFRNKSVLEGFKVAESESNFAKVTPGWYGDHIQVDKDGGVLIFPKAYADDVVAFVAGCLHHHAGITPNIQYCLVDFVNKMDERAMVVHGYDASPEEAAYVWKKAKVNKDDVSDGYHTFRELYMHRMALTLCMLQDTSRFLSHKSLRHHPLDQPCFDDSFVVMFYVQGKQCSYHYDLKYWDMFVSVPTKEHADKWDGHTPENVVGRILDGGGVPDQ